MSYAATAPATQRFIEQLNRVERNHAVCPTWDEVVSLGTPLVALSHDEFRQPSDGETYFLTTGEAVQMDARHSGAYHAGWWHDANTTLLRTPAGDRFHRPGIGPVCSIYRDVFIDPTARVESGAVIESGAQVHAYAHIGSMAHIYAGAMVGRGAWIGPDTELAEHTRISYGAFVEPHCWIGCNSAVGAGCRVTQGSRIEAYSRLGAGSTITSTGPNRPREDDRYDVQIIDAIVSPSRLGRD